MKRRHILFLILPIFATILSAIALNNFISSYIIKQTKEKIQNVLLSNRGFHRYIQEVLHPAFFEAVKNGYISYDYYNPEFLSSSFIIRTMHGLYNQEREKNRLVKIYYKMAANNPRNPVNKADEEEARLIKLFNENSSIKEYEQVVSVKGKKYLYYAIPFLRNDHRCLKCHGDPSTAPVGLMQRYPLEGGFYERLGEIRAIESIRIPVDEEEYTAMKITIPLSAGFLTVLLLFFFNTGLRQQVRNKTKNLEEEIAVRIKAENALKEALKKAEDEQEKTKAILAGIGEGISIQDRDFKIIYQNDIQKEMMGNQEGKYCYRAYENKEAVCENCQLALSFKDGLIHHAERTVESPEGKRYFDITSSPIKDSSGEIVAGVESVRDVTERRLARVELEAEKERLAVTLRSIGDGVIVTDTSGMITLINKSAEHLTGWKDEDARGRELSEIFNIINEETRQRCENPADNVLRNGAIVSLQSNTILIRKDGSEIVIADSAAPIMDYMSKTIGVVLVFRDVTTQQQLEKEMRKIQKLESLGVLAGGLAHDFNNLLTSIMGNISLAKMYAGSDNKAFNRLIEAEKAAQRAADLTKQMLTFSKGGAPIKKPALISDIVKEAVGFALSGANIKCIYKESSGLWISEVDKGQMVQVFNNLIINSIQAMPSGGNVWIEFENVTITEENNLSTSASPMLNGDYVKITFRDEGSGIPDDLIDHIFEPYFTTKREGNGLGLATVFSIIKRHNGYITVDSGLSKGTVFTIHIPAVRNLINPDASASYEIKTGKGRVLIMDDESIIRDVAGEILNLLGYDTIFAEDGSEAVDKYAQSMRDGNPFDVVIMDLTVPGGMGGKYAVKRLLELDPNAKVIVSSGYSTDPIMADYRKYGFSEVITKPYDINQVSQVLTGLLKTG